MKYACDVKKIDSDLEFLQLFEKLRIVLLIISKYLLTYWYIVRALPIGFDQFLIFEKLDQNVWTSQKSFLVKTN